MAASDFAGSHLQAGDSQAALVIEYGCLRLVLPCQAP